MRAPWWTEADQAELEAGIWAMICAADETPACRTVVVELLCSWYERRIVVSRAEWYRRRHLNDRLAEIEEMASA